MPMFFAGTPGRIQRGTRSQQIKTDRRKLPEVRGIWDCQSGLYRYRTQWQLHAG